MNISEADLNSPYPLLIFIVGVPGSFAHEIGQRIAYEYGFFFIGITQRFNRPQEEQREAQLRANDNNDRHFRLPFVGSWQLDQRVAVFLLHTKHLRNRACLVIEGYPRHTRHIPHYWRAAQRLFIFCDCPKPVAEQRAVGGPLDWDPTAPADRKAREETGWNESAVGAEYWDTKHEFDEDWWVFEQRIPSLVGHFVASPVDDQGPSSAGWRTVFRYVLSESFTPGKVLLLETGEGDFDDCWARAREKLQNSLEFRTLLAEIERDFETMADEDEVDDDDADDDVDDDVDDDDEN